MTLILRKLLASSSFAISGTLENLIGLGGYPTGMLNRTTEWNSPEPNYISQVLDLTTSQSDVGLALNPTLNANTMNIDVSVKFGGQFSASNAKLVVYVLEDGLVFNQTNYIMLLFNYPPMIGMAN